MNDCILDKGEQTDFSTRNQVEIKEITRNQGNHKKSRKSREIKEINRNHEKSTEIKEINRNHGNNRKSLL